MVRSRDDRCGNSLPHVVAKYTRTASRFKNQGGTRDEG